MRYYNSFLFFVMYSRRNDVTDFDFRGIYSNHSTWPVLPSSALHHDAYAYPCASSQRRIRSTNRPIAWQRSENRCYWVRMYAAVLGIELIFLPSYSPNLNLIERYWKFLKKKCLYNEFYSDFESFRNAIDGCLADSDKKYAHELKTLMTLKFQSFENIQFLAV